MIKYLKIEPEDAIKRFKECRGYEIERINYLASLQNMDRSISFERTNRSRRRSSDSNSPDRRISYSRDRSIREDWRPRNRFDDRDQQSRPSYHHYSNYNNGNSRDGLYRPYHTSTRDRDSRQIERPSRTESGYNKFTHNNRYDASSWTGIRDRSEYQPSSSTSQYHRPEYYHKNHHRQGHSDTIQPPRDNKPSPYSWRLNRS